MVCAFEWVDRDHLDRRSIEIFIARVYWKHFHADVSHFSDTLIGLRDTDGEWVASLGFSALAMQHAYLERYLDLPVDRAIASMRKKSDLSGVVSRWDLAELGNLASLRPGFARQMIVYMTQFLHRRHFRWVVFTATTELRNSFRKVGYEPKCVAQADPLRLGTEAFRWGNYYEHRPQVMYGDVTKAFSQIERINASHSVSI